MNFLRLSYAACGHHVCASVRQVLEPVCELALAPAFHNPTASGSCQKSDNAEPIPERMQQPEDRADDRDCQCDDPATNRKELTEDTHMLERQIVRHDCAELFGLNLASSHRDGLHAYNGR